MSERHRKKDVINEPVAFPQSYFSALEMLFKEEETVLCTRWLGATEREWPIAKKSNAVHLFVAEAEKCARQQK